VVEFWRFGVVIGRAEDEDEDDGECMGNVPKFGVTGRIRLITRRGLE